jgi:SagB-type dehydrogenase family enzyme
MLKYINYVAEPGISAEGFDFLEASKLAEYDVINFSTRIPAIMGIPYYTEQIINHSPELGFCEKTPLVVSKSEHTPLMDIQRKRKSLRKFDPEGLSFEELSDLLHLSYCITNQHEHKRSPPSRNIASPGALFPIDLYFVNQRVKGLKKGVYYYNLIERCLQLVSDHRTEEENDTLIKRAFLSDYQTDIDFANASGVIVLGATFNRSCFKYQDKGIRFTLIDTGAIIHSLYLACASLEISCCGSGGYIDDLVDEVIGYESAAQTVTGVIAVGKTLK